MTEAPHDLRWLSHTEMRAWRPYMVATLMLRQRLHRELSENHGLSLIDYEVLAVLSTEPDYRMRMSELATMLGSTKSRLSHQVGRMEDAGYLRRDRDRDDRRGVTAELTTKGAELLERAAPTHVGGVREHFIDLLDHEQHQMLSEVYTRVLTHLTELGE
jgi:DNA-binding MarR family transcriptional regulator